MNDYPGVRNISCVETVAALVVMLIWSAVLLTVVALGLTFYGNRTELGMVSPTERPTPRAIALAWPTEESTLAVTSRLSATTPPRLEPTPQPSATPVAPTVAPPATAAETVTPAAARGKARATATGTPPPTSTPTAPPTPTATRVVKLGPSPSPEPTSTPMATVTATAAPAPKPPTGLGDGAPPLNQGQMATLDGAPRLVAGNPTAAPIVAFRADTGPLMAPPPPAGDAPTRIVIPKINLDSKIVPVGWRMAQENGRSVSLWDVADFATGWHRGSAYPGNVGNTVVSGHHNIKGEVFRYVVDLEPGDEVDLFVATQRYSYHVTEKHILREKGMPEDVRNANARWIAQTTDQRLTLVTCWPYSNNTHRLIVVAKPTWK